MDANTLHEVEEVMVDKVALAYHLALSIICQGNGVPYKLAMATVKLCSTVLGVAEKDVAAVDDACPQKHGRRPADAVHLDQVVHGQPLGRGMAITRNATG